MNREIKVKIWDKYTKIMSEPFEISELVDFDITWQERMKGQREISFCDLIWIQYTGLSDVNGKEVYEGDIVEAKEEVQNIALGERGKVVWSNLSFMAENIPPWNWDIMSPCFNLEAVPLEVIGNIYQNPELLKGGKDGE